MDYFIYQNDQLYCENVPIAEITARFGTPCYIYSRAMLEHNWQAFLQPLAAHEHLLCYAVKANANLGILNLLARLGSGFDIVSGGELARVIAAGGDAHKVIFSGVGKTHDEIVRALEVGIYCFNVESVAELVRLNHIAGEMGCHAPVALRVNPNVDAGTHHYIATGLKENKFGIQMDAAEEIYLRAANLPNLRLLGIDCHIGSQLTTLTPFIDAVERILHLVDRLKEHGIILSHIDMGGGLGITYHHEQPPTPHGYTSALLQALHNRPLLLILEPGRAIVGNAGVLITKIEYLKHTPHKNFAIVDAAMNDLLRPALYHAWHDIIPVTPRTDTTHCYDIVGPVCESGDFLGKDRQLALHNGDLLAVRTAGAYGFSMSSNYNTRPRAAEIIVDNHHVYCVRARESIAELFAKEQLLP